tara:strand:- start:312 stop:497 length:186 start_codon:yes stop_codon:yes gene_type:complete
VEAEQVDHKVKLVDQVEVMVDVMQDLQVEQEIHLLLVPLKEILVEQQDLEVEQAEVEHLEQ